MEQQEENYNAMLELQKFAVEWFKKKSGEVVLLCLAVVWLWWDSSGRLAELKAQVARQNVRIEEQIREIRNCDTERARLESRVEWLVSELSHRFPKLGKKYDESR
jgi:uncharacterized coiled-coil protein SlyX